MILGAKILRADGSSIREEGRVTYPLGGWVTVPGGGAYVCVKHGDAIRCGGDGPLLVVLECEEPTGVSTPFGVTCYRRVRRLTAGVNPAGPLAGYALARDVAWAKYNRVCDTERAKYYRACDIKQAVCVTAWAECDRVRDVARAEYYQACATAWAEILRGLVPSCGVLE